ncbi:CWC16 protein [Chaetomium fimeti]|uniref:Splicing factor YJU2 n=1 Tax=Chaetomium fimeti TaxID=1854472 RepID=A0AAE0HML8_9PEZI|nr:CWC16 protein [Chaetomium fimeti]
MSERKVLTKYYPPDFDPSLVGRARKPKGSAAQQGPKVQTVRLMAPFSLRCVACGEYMYRGRKFNARKETPPGERYLGIQLYRFYIRCTRCSGEIVFRTDPKNQDYVVEKGAKRNTDPWKRGLGGEDGENGGGGAAETDDQRLDRLEREMEAEGEEERNAMAELEAKTEDAKREMAVADALDEIRSRNARLEKANREGGGDVLDAVVAGVVRPEEEERRRQEEEDAEAARKAFAFVRRQDMLEEVVEEDGEGDDAMNGGGVLNGNGVGSGSGSSSATASTSDSKPPSAAATPDMPPPPPPSFKRQVKKKKDHAALLGIKKKKPLV